MGFYAFTIKYIFMHLSTTKPKTSMAEIELQKQLALYHLSYVTSIICIQSFMIILL